MMRVRQVSEHVWSVGVWMIIPVQVWLVGTEDGIVLVDAGLASMANGILETIRSLNKGPLRAVLLTHGHSDHVGALKAILSRVDVPVYAHSEEIPFASGQKPYPKRKRAVESVSRNLLRALPTETDSDVLTSMFGLRPYHTPGHAPGHVVYSHPEDKVLIAGDLFTSKRGELRRPIPMFTPFMDEAVRSGAVVTDIKPEVMTVCHGGDVARPHEQYPAYHEKWGR